ncbi:fumarylacetoacetate hydrolase family protein [Notoacmeibacter ruber]|uniref:FAA hydrolase family protein n=1 Tax=Notoacmeibacter ruber TaxID=2670375 RepID=A0A3L7JAA9_9HYPH|nr:fumarylacetoacetate hydrolase family protein [Notoacmeibacter ruber]RLQ87556.1 FAA hydrolase family protein [Notoacmeibacter ruber]
MTEFVIDVPETPSVAVAGTDSRFPVRRIFCVGRNYAAHAREMGNDPDREPPFFFTKPADAVVDAGRSENAVIPYPPETEDLHYEVELTVAIGKGGRNIAPDRALDHVFGYAVGLDLTRRDLQAAAKKMGRPWDCAKGFDRSAPLAPIQPAGGYDPARGRIWLSVDGETKQEADLADLIWPVRDVIAIVSQSMELQPGDLIMTGTPAGVGAVVAGQRLEGGVDGLEEIVITIGDRE